MQRILVIVLLLCGFQSQLFAQAEKFLEARKAFHAKEFEKAKEYIDAASNHTETSKDAPTWLYKGFIYKELYKSKQAKDKSSPYRTEAMDAYLNYFKYAPEDEPNREQAAASYRFLLSKIQNDAAVSLTPGGYEQAIKCYDQYLKYAKKMYPDTSLTDQEIEFSLVLAGVFERKYKTDREANKEYFAKAEEQYHYILQLDSNHYSGNYNLALLYYNEAVERVYGVGFVDINEMPQVQEDAALMFENALPYMQKAYKMNPNRKEAIIGLSGIYYALNEYEKSDKLDQKLKELEQDK